MNWYCSDEKNHDQVKATQEAQARRYTELAVTLTYALTVGPSHLMSQ